jgi:hypothetical protein
LKLGLYKLLYPKIRKIFGTCAPRHTPEEDGKEIFLKLKGGEYNYYDTSMAEKLDGMVVDLPFRTCLSQKGFDVLAGMTKVSGSFSTRLDMFMTQSLIHRVMFELGVFIPDPGTLGGGDNFARKAPLDANPVIDHIFSTSERFLGCDKHGVLGFRILRDGADTNYAIGKGTGYTFKYKRIPLSSIAVSAIILGITDVSYWDMFDRVKLDKVSFFEAGGPHNYFLETDWNEIVDVVTEASTQLTFISDTDVIDDLAQPIPNDKYTIQPRRV